MTNLTNDLERLATLYKEGLLTREQFEEQRDQLLASARGDATPPPSPPTDTPPTTDDLSGQRVGEYRLDRKLGEGGMGSVYLATHEALGQQVAVKVLDPGLARNSEVRERFLQEARIQIGLRHPGIVLVHTAVTEGPHLALVMEHVDGWSLSEVIERRGALPVEEALGLFGQVLDAVGHAHSQGIVHRDIKPSNVMVQADGTAKVMDFGIAKVVGGAKLTRTGTVMGSAHYMSPEQIVGSRDVDLRTDIYSLGIAFYEVLTGRTPFEGVGGDTTDSDFLIKRAHTDQAAPDPRTLRPDLPELLAGSLLRALAKEPGERYESCAAFRDALLGAAGPTPERKPPVEHEVVAEEPPPPEPPPRPPKPPTPPPVVSEPDEFTAGRSSMPWVAIGIGLGAVVVLGVIVIVAIAIGSAVSMGGGSSKQVSERGSEQSHATSTSVLDDHGYRMVRIEPGTFWMGSSTSQEDRDDDEIRHKVTITGAFSIGSTEVTQGLYRAVVGSNPSHFSGDSNPVESISWWEAVEFCNKLSEREGRRPAYEINGERVTWDAGANGYRLPTEAEWEYAARAGTSSRFYWGNSDGMADAKRHAWYRRNAWSEKWKDPHAATEGTQPVGSRTPNAWNLYDTAGNVWEWCWDWYGPYPSGSVTDPTGPSSGDSRVIRGGSWRSEARSVRPANRRDKYSPGNREYANGFRVAVDAG